MKILSKTNKNNKPTSFVGTQVDVPIGVYISLYCMAKGISKSSFIRGLVERFFKSDRYIEKDDLLNLVIQRAKKKWILRKSEAVNKETFDDYVDCLKQELCDKGIDAETRVKIANGFKDEER